MIGTYNSSRGNFERIRIERALSEKQKAGTSSTFFTRAKEELDYIPAVLKVLEYWPEKAVFAEDDGSEDIVAARRPIHPLGKCFASTSLLAQIVSAKYADSLPLYHQESILKRYGGEISRTNLANWIIRLDGVFNPLMNLIREERNNGYFCKPTKSEYRYSRNPVVVPSPTSGSGRVGWVIRGGPHDKPAVMSHYDPSRSGKVPVRLLDDLNGVLQADGYSCYAQVCRVNSIARIGSWEGLPREVPWAPCAAQVRGSKQRGGTKKSERCACEVRRGAEQDLQTLCTGIKDRGSDTGAETQGSTGNRYPDTGRTENQAGAECHPHAKGWTDTQGHAVHAQPVGQSDRLLRERRTEYQQCPCEERGPTLCNRPQGVVVLGHATGRACLGHVLFAN